eukprot:m51a1_g5118 putative ricin b lectin (837) ;mRNA; f:364291-368824
METLLSMAGPSKDIPQKIAKAQELKEQANAAFRSGDLQKALLLYNQVPLWVNGLQAMAKEDKEKVDALKLQCELNLTAVHLKLNDAKRALVHAKKAVEMDPGNVKALYRRGKAYSMRGMNDNALEDLRKALSKDPANPEIANEIRSVEGKLAAESQAQKRVMAKAFSAMFEDEGTQKQAEASSERTITPFRSKFEHPGMIWTRSQLDVLRDKVKAGEQAWRNPDLRRNEYFKDMYNVGSLAFIWYVEKDWSAAEKAITILSRWAKTHTGWSGVESPFLAADSLDGIVGADILYGTYPNYTAERHKLIRGYFGSMWGWLASVGFAPLCPGHRTGAGSHLWGANQGTLQLQVSMATAVFTDDFLLFDETVSAMLTDPIGGFLDTLPSGQVGDTGRDNGHGANQFGYMVWVAEVAWIQGVDVFSALNNRLLAESEYSAQRQLHGFNISGVPEVPFSVFGSSYSMWDRLPAFDGVVRHLGSMSTAYTLYTSRRLAMPYTKMYLDHNKFVPLTTIDTGRSTVVPDGPFVEPAASPKRLESSLSVAAMGTLWRSGSGKFLGDGKWVLSAGGGDGGWEACKGLVFAYKQFDGDATFIAQVLTGGGEVRLIDRLQASPGARQVRMFLSPALYSNFWRGACCSYAVVREQNANLGLPAWAKIVRRGNYVYSYSSPDGKSWCPQSNLILDNLGKTVFIGLSVISGNATFANVMYAEAPLSRPDAPAVVRVVRSPRGPSGAAITLGWDRNDKAVYYYVWRAENSTGPFTVVAPHVLANQFTDGDVKAGKTYWYKVQCAGYSGDAPVESPVIQATATLPGLVISAAPRAPLLSVMSLVLLMAAASIAL